MRREVGGEGLALGDLVAVEVIGGVGSGLDGRGLGALEFEGGFDLGPGHGIADQTGGDLDLR